jgi:tetratricopeptide (TPR) repeat protein
MAGNTSVAMRHCRRYGGTAAGGVRRRPARLLPVVSMLAFLAAAPLPAAADDYILSVSPLYSIPLSAPQGVYSALSLGASVSATLPFPLFDLSWLRPEAGIGYVYSGLRGSTSSVSAIEAQAGLAVRYPVVPWMDVTGTLALRAGYYFLLGGAQATSGFSPGISLDGGADFKVSEMFSLGVGVQGVYDIGMYIFLRPFISGSVRFGGTSGQEPVTPKQEAPVKPTPLGGENREKPKPAASAADPIEFSADGIFPVFYKYYENHPFGSITLANRGKSPWTDVRTSFTMKQFMDMPTTLAAVPSIMPGQSVTLDLVTLFNDSILSVTEATKVSGELVTEYKENGKPARLSRTISLRVYDRNAMTWADDQRAAAFVTAKDPAILSLAKGLAGDLSAAKNPAISDRLQAAAGVHDALCLYGINYVPDPTSVFSGSKTKTDIDFLQFPRQTLEYRAGDCDDLSILYSAFFEAAGIETAFITVPGHIFMAVSLDMAPEEAKSRFGKVDDLILRDGKTWLPIEVTMRKGGFMAAWTEGAKEWRENQARGKASLLPVHAAWGQYEPVAMPGSASLPPFPNAKAVEAMKADIVAFVTGEIGERAAKLQADSRKAKGASKAVNALGILYAQYGLYDKASAQFESIVAKEEYVPALVNLGNIRKTLGETDAALAFYDRAYRKSPTSPSVLLAEAIINHELENYGAVRKYYQALKAQNGALADRYSFLDLRGEEGAKAADASGLKKIVEWMEGQ